MVRFLVTFVMLLATGAWAGVYTVDGVGDEPDALPGDGVCAAPDGSCTLRAAVHETNALPGLDEIVIPAGLYMLTRGQPLHVRDGLVVRGAGAGQTMVDGGGITNVFRIATDVLTMVRIEDLTIQNGTRGMTVAGAVDLFLTRSVFRFNRATNQAGAGLLATGGRIVVRDSTFHDNHATGFLGEGAAIFYINYDATRAEFLHIENSTFTGNSSPRSIVGVEGLESTRITSSTIAGNSGAGFYRAGDNNALPIEFVPIRSSIIQSCVGTPPNSLGGNLEVGVSCGFTGGSDLQNADPMLGPLADNGGPTPTRALLPGSPAIDRGVGCPPPYGDQRGLARPAGPQCDSGAFELGASGVPAPVAGDPGTLVFGSPTWSTSEHLGFLSIGIDRIGGTAGYVSAFVVPAAGTATDADYDPVPRYFSFPDGSDHPPAFLTIAIVDDAIDEPDETFTLSLQSQIGGAAVGPPSTVTITDNDDPVVPAPGFLFASAQTQTHEMIGTMTVTVSRFNGSSGAVSVDYQTADVTATAGSDYQAVSGTLSWPDGDTTPRPIVIPILDDTLVDPGETFTFSLTNPTGGALTGSPVTITILDDESVNPGLVRFVASSFTGSETAGTVTLTAERVGGTQFNLIVDYAQGEGSAGFDDFRPVRCFLRWLDGEGGPKSFTLTIYDDDLYEPDETFPVSLTRLGGPLGSPSTATVVIEDNEDEPPPPFPGRIEFESAPSGVFENAGPAVVRIARSGGTAGAVSVDYTTAPITAQPVTDYVTTSGTLTWADGDGETKEVLVPLVDDATSEPDESLRVELSNPIGAPIVGSGASEIRIRDDDRTAESSGTIRFVDATFDATEGDSDFFVLAERVGNTIGEVTVWYEAVPGTATDPDFQLLAPSPSIRWNDGEGGIAFIEVRVTDDAIPEPMETFVIRLLDPQGGAALGAPAEMTIRIHDNDGTSLAGTLAMASAAQSVGEGAGTVGLQVTRTGGSSGAVSVSYATAAGSAVAGADFTSASGTLSWASGDAAPKTIAVTLLQDLIVEPDEMFTVSLSNPTGGATLGTPSTVVTVIDDDAPPPAAGSISWSAATASVVEGAGTVTLVATRGGGSAGAVSVQADTTAGSATEAVDFQASSTVLSWADGESGGKPFTIPILDDGTAEGSETFTAILSSPTGGATLGAVASATVTIVDDDDPDAANIPTLSGWMLILLGLAIAAVGLGAVRQ